MINFLFNLPLKLKKLIVLFVDLILSCASLIISFFLLENINFQYNTIYYLFIIFSFIFFFLIGKNYSEIIRFTNIYNIFNILKLLFYNLILILTISFIIYGFEIKFIQLTVVYSILLSIIILLSRFFILFIYDNLKLLNKRNLIIYGAGEAGVLVFNNFKNYKVVAFIDDDENKIGRTIQGVNIISDNGITKLIENYKIDLIIVAIPSLNNSRRSQIIENLNKFNIEIKLLPKLDNLVLGNFNFNKFTLLPSDLIERKIEWNKQEVFNILRNKIILVTGGGGSLGSSLVKNIINSNIKKLIILDNNEYNLFKIMEEIKKLINFYKINTKVEYQLLSINDFFGIKKIFLNNKIDFVFHAAAYKHVNLLESNIYSAYKNNIIGSYNLVNLSREFKCEKFIFISTDKAVNPSSIMGKTKRIIENYITYIQNSDPNHIFSIVRFGNVINSNGSVIPIFENQIINRQPITLTHPDVTRFFMSIDEAIILVLETLRFKKNNVIYVLNMGKPIKILDLAKKLISIHGLKIKNEKNPKGDIEIKIIGLREGEKMHEELFYKNTEKNILNENIYYQENLINLSVYDKFDDDLKIIENSQSDIDIEKIFDKYL